MKTYQSCGQIDHLKRKTTVFTYLPDLNINFRFTRFFNITSKTHYGVVGILVNDGTNIDLSALPSRPTHLPGELDLKNLDYTFSKFGFNELASDDQICFYCYHDDEFNTVNLSVKEHETLAKIQASLPTFVSKSNHVITEIIFPTISVTTPHSTGEPKKGNGGVLTVTGSCTP